jgi:hypothetical protein
MKFRGARAAGNDDVGRKMIVRWFLGWPILGCRPTSDCRSNPIQAEGERFDPQSGRAATVVASRAEERAPCSAVRGRVPVSGISDPGWPSSDFGASGAHCCVVKTLNTERSLCRPWLVSDFEDDRYFFYLFFVGMYGNYTRHLDLRLPRTEAVI